MVIIINYLKNKGNIEKYFKFCISFNTYQPRCQKPLSIVRIQLYRIRQHNACNALKRIR